MNSYEDANKVGKEAMVNALKSFSAVSKGLQQVATETNDFTKRSYEQSAQMIEKIMQSKSIETALEAQGEFAKTSYQHWVSQATKMSEIYAEIAKEAYKPFQTSGVTAAYTGPQLTTKAA